MKIYSKKYAGEGLYLIELSRYSFCYIHNGKVISENFKRASEFSRGYATVKLSDNTFALINKKCQVLIQGFYYLSTVQMNNFCVAQFQDESTGYLNVKDFTLYDDYKKLIQKGDERYRNIIINHSLNKKLNKLFEL